MNPLVVLKLLDLAMLGFTAWQRYEESQEENEKVAREIAIIRRKLLTGEISEEEAAAQIEAWTLEVTQRRRKSFEALPKPIGG